MYQIKTIPFKKEHVEVMDVRAHELRLLNDGLLDYLQSGVAFTGIVDGRIISCGGLNMLGYNNADLWQIPSVYVDTMTIAYAKYIRKWVLDMKRKFQLDRMETLCVDDSLHDRWMKFLGFEREGVKRRYIEGQDYALWGRIW